MTLTCYNVVDDLNVIFKRRLFINE